MKDNLTMIYSVDMVVTNFLMVKFIKENGKMILWMEREN